MRTAVRAAIVTIVGLGAVCSVATGAGAGGGSDWLFDRPFYEPGDRVAAVEDSPLLSADQSLDDGPFGVWIEPFDESQPSFLTLAETVERALYVADVRIEMVEREVFGGRAEVPVASVQFTLPPVARGLYTLLHCNYPCTRTLANGPSGYFWVGPPDPDVNIRTTGQEPNPIDVFGAPPTTTTIPVPTTLPAERVQPASALRESPTPEGSDGNTLPIVAGGLVLALAAGSIAVARKRRVGEP